jgi:nucleoside 2-deoxyribosyltransferase
MTKRVYLAGPITGLSYADGQDWRDYAIKELESWDIEGLSPLRGKDYLAAFETIDKQHIGRTDWPLSLPQGIVGRDRNDVKTSDLILVNFADAKKVSIGTCMEIAWADAFRVPVLMVRGEVHDHEFINQLVAWSVDTLEEALTLVPAILNAKRTEL